MQKPLIWGLVALSAALLLPAAKAPTPPRPTSRPVVSPTPRPPDPALIAAGRQTWQAACSFCHVPKAPQSLPDLKAWQKLLYTRGCPQVKVSLNDAQRRQILAFLTAELTARRP
jgi:hypothetical protein